MDDDETVEEVVDGSIAPVVPIVHVSRNKTRNDSYHEDDDEDERSEHDKDDAEDYEDDDFEEVVSPRQPQPAARAQLHQPQYKSTNGKKKIDMSPPDEKLKRSEALAHQFIEEGKADKAITEFTKCLAFARIVHGSSHWKYAKTVVNLAEAYFNLKGYHAQAEYHADSAKSIMLTGGGHTASSYEEKANVYAVLIKIYRVLGQALTGLKKFNEADQSLMKADKISQERSKLDCVTDASCDTMDISLYLAMARLYGKQKKYALACTKYDKVLELMEHQYGTDDPQVMKIYTEYGKLEQSKGRHANHDKSIHLMLQAHSIASAIHKEGHPELVDTALNLSQAYANTGREDSEGLAKGYLEECLNTCTVIYGPSHKRTLEVEDHLARLLIRTDNLQEAMLMLKSSLPNKCETFGDYSEPVCDTYKLMGSVCLAQGELEKALRLYKKCHVIELVLHGKSHRKTKDTQQTMELIMANPSVSKKFVLDKADELQKRPRFNGIVARVK